MAQGLPVTKPTGPFSVPFLLDYQQQRLPLETVSPGLGTSSLFLRGCSFSVSFARSMLKWVGFPSEPSPDQLRTLSTSLQRGENEAPVMVKSYFWVNVLRVWMFKKSSNSQLPVTDTFVRMYLHNGLQLYYYRGIYDASLWHWQHCPLQTKRRPNTSLKVNENVNQQSLPFKT